jgi:hypothetical protein
MRRCAVLAVLMLTGCSTAPVADLMDHFHPSSAGPSVTVARPIMVPARPVIKSAPASPIVPRPPAGPLPVVVPSETQPWPPSPPWAEPAPQPTPIPDGVVPITYRPRTETEPRREPKKIVDPTKPPIAPAVYRFQESPPRTDPLPSTGFSDPR